MLNSAAEQCDWDSFVDTNKWTKAERRLSGTWIRKMDSPRSETRIVAGHTNKSRKKTTFLHIEKAIADAVDLKDLPAGWDDAGAQPIQAKTWERAVTALRGAAEFVWARHDIELPAPTIGPCPDGSIDLYWSAGSITLLLNIQSEAGSTSDFYGRKPNLEIKGPFNPDSADFSFLYWLFS